MITYTIVCIRMKRNVCQHIRVYYVLWVVMMWKGSLHEHPSTFFVCNEQVLELYPFFLLNGSLSYCWTEKLLCEFCNYLQSEKTFPLHLDLVLYYILMENMYGESRLKYDEGTPFCIDELWFESNVLMSFANNRFHYLHSND